MALSTYADLQAAVAEWLERSDLSARIPDFIALAEVQINRALRQREMMRRASAIISEPFSAAPDDLAEARLITLSDGNGEWELAPATPDQIASFAVIGEVGRPRFWSLVGTEFRYYPAPDGSYAARLLYYGRTPSLTNAAPTNWLLANHPDVLLFGALKEAGPFLEDADRTATFEAKYRTALAEVRAAERLPVGRLRAEPALMSAAHTNNITG